MCGTLPLLHITFSWRGAHLKHGAVVLLCQSHSPVFMLKEDIMCTVVLIKTSRFAGHFVPISLLTAARWETADTTGVQAKG